MKKLVLKSRQECFPMKMPGGVAARAVTQEKFEDVFRTLFKKVFPYDNPLWFRIPIKRRKGMKHLQDTYQQLHHEYVVFYKNNKPIGWLMGESEDLITFYIRNVGVLPRYQNRGIYTAFLKKFLQYLNALKYERVTSNHKPTNRAVLISHLKVGFEVAGMELQENFGPLLKLVYIFYHDRKKSFYRQFGDKNNSE